ncbi:MAG: RNA polymerase sigma factor [Eubacteriales bacterium]
MQNNNPEQYTDFLLTAALRKCGNLEDAEDLTQETLLAALVYLNKGNVIADIKGWLITVLNRRFYDLLRKKYKLPTVSYEAESDTAADNCLLDEVFGSDEEEKIRGTVAFLSKLYREVIVRRYMKNESVYSIAAALKIPVGTVKSRLSAGREQIKKGIDTMENYAKQSYEPETLYMSISGCQGLHEEPVSVTRENPIAQNILILAYDKPLTEEEISKAIGIPAAYIEPEVEKLVKSELMKRAGKKVYTDFIIFRPEDNIKHICAEKRLVEHNFPTYWEPIKQGLEKLRNTAMYLRQNRRQCAKFEYYFLIHCFDKGFYNAGARIYDGYQHFPDRPNGGKWIAMGHAYPRGFDFDSAEFRHYNWAGERRDYWHNTLGAKEICLRVYDTPLEAQRYYNLKYNMNDSELAQMLYIINEGVDPSGTGFNTAFFENLPYLAECGVVYSEKDNTIVDIPVLDGDEYRGLAEICSETTESIGTAVYPSLKEHLLLAKTPVPKHLTSVPEQKQYMKAMNSLHMMMVYKARELGHILNGIDFPCPPMILTFQK